MKTFTIIYCILSLGLSSKAQVSINTNGAAASSTSMLDVQSTSRGVKFPRMTTAQRNAITVTSADAGLILFDTDQSSLYMYDGAQWLPFATLSAKTRQLAERVPSNISSNARAGASVSISGEYAAVGCPHDSINGTHQAGSVIIYKKTNGTWVEHAKLTSTDISFENFGTAVSLSGNTLAVGATYAKVAGVGQGAVYTYTLTGNTWIPQQKLYANDGASGNYFGSAVMLHQGSLYVGSSHHTATINEQGSVYVFNQSGNTFVPLTRINGTEAGQGDHFGASLAAHNNSLVVGAPDDDNLVTSEGSAYVFIRSGNTFTQQAKLKYPGSANNANTYFGKAVGIYNDLVLVGVPNMGANSGFPAGAVLTFKRTGTTWTYAFGFSANANEKENKQFGYSICMLSDKSFLIGAPFESINGMEQKGAVYHFGLSPSGLGEVLKYRHHNSNPFPATAMGFSIASNGTDVLIGSPGPVSRSTAGSVYFGLIQ